VFGARLLRPPENAVPVVRIMRLAPGNSRNRDFTGGASGMLTGNGTTKVPSFAHDPE